MVFVVPVAVKVFYPIYFKMELTSCYEYLGIRFGKEIRVLGAVLYVLQVNDWRGNSIYQFDGIESLFLLVAH